MTYLEDAIERNRYKSVSIAHQFMLDLTEKIIEQMEEMDINLEELIEKSGLDEVVIGKIMKCDHDLTVEQISKVLSVLKIDFYGD